MHGHIPIAYLHLCFCIVIAASLRKPMRPLASIQVSLHMGILGQGLLQKRKSATGVM